MNKKIKTIDLQGKDYAQVKDRIREFRGDCPKGLIETKPTIQPDGSILFKARIVKDKSDEASAEATGHAMGDNKGAKAFEKLETIAVGRALALLGYGADGEIASAEEMEDFLEYQKEKKDDMLEASKEKLGKVKNLDELKSVWADLPVDAKEALEGTKDELKKKYDKPKKVLAKKQNENTKIPRQGELV